MGSFIDDIESVVGSASEADILYGGQQAGSVPNHRIHVIEQDVHALVTFWDGKGGNYGK